MDANLSSNGEWTPLCCDTSHFGSLTIGTLVLLPVDIRRNKISPVSFYLSITHFIKNYKILLHLKNKVAVRRHWPHCFIDKHFELVYRCTKCCHSTCHFITIIYRLLTSLCHSSSNFCYFLKF